MTESRAVPYVRWQRDEPRKARREFAPLTPEHPMHHEPCPMCTRQLGDGTPVTLVAVGPDSEEAWDRHQAGRWYSAQAITVHVACVGEKVTLGFVHWDLPARLAGWDCPRCLLPLRTPAMLPCQSLRVGPDQEPIMFHATCLGTDPADLLEEQANDQD